MAPSKTEKTITACSNLQISSISQEWTENAWNSEFCESQGFPEVVENSISDRGYFVRELKELLLISKQWTTSTSQDTLNEGELAVGVPDYFASELVDQFSVDLDAIVPIVAPNAFPFQTYSLIQLRYRYIIIFKNTAAVVPCKSLS